jgi:hypothetical protein
MSGLGFAAKYGASPVARLMRPASPVTNALPGLWAIGNPAAREPAAGVKNL